MVVKISQFLSAHDYVVSTQMLKTHPLLSALPLRNDQSGMEQSGMEQSGWISTS